MNLVSLNDKLIEAERLISADSDDAKTHGMLLLRGLIAVSKPKPVDRRRPDEDDDDDRFNNVPV